MGAYVIEEINQPDPVPPNTAILIASGDLRFSANQTCWPAQAAMEAQQTVKPNEVGPAFTPHRVHAIIRIYVLSNLSSSASWR